MSTGDRPSEEELRAAYESELKKIRVEQILLEQVVTLVNLGMRRTGLAPGTEDERDPEQVRLAIESVRALMPLIEQSAPAQAARDADERVPYTDLPNRLIEENMWRAIRYGLDGDLLDLERLEPYPAPAALDRLLDWTAPVRAELGLEISLPALNGAQRQRRMLQSGMSLAEVYAAVQAETRETYSGVLETPRR